MFSRVAVYNEIKARPFPLESSALECNRNNLSIVYEPDGFEKRYDEKMRALHRNIALKNLKSHFIFYPKLRKAVMKSGLQSMQIKK
jgi:hypothetical protein